MSRDAREDDLHDLIVEASGRPELWNDVLTALIELFGSEAGALYMPPQIEATHSDAAVTEVIPFQGYGAGVMERYNEHYHALNPFHAHGSLFAPGHVLTEASLRKISRDFDLAETEFFVDWCRPQNFHHPMGEILLKDGEPLLLWLNRGGSAGDFGPEDQRRFHRLSRGVLSSLRTAERLGEARSELAIARKVLDSQSIAVLTLDRSLKLRSANARAEDILRLEDGLRLRQGQVEPTHAENVIDFRQAIFRATSPLVGIVSSDISILLRRPNDRPPFQLSIMATRGRHGLSGFDQAVSAVLSFRAPSETRGPNMNLFASHFRLTPSELRLAMALRDGAPLPTVAKELGIGYETARSQLKSIFSKTETQRQAELVRQMSQWLNNAT